MRIATTLLISLISFCGAALSAPNSDLDKPTWYVDLQIGTYEPRIDSQFEQAENSTVAPFEAAFGTESTLSVQLGAERHIWSGIGTLSVGLSIGYWCLEGKAIAANGSEESDATDTTEFVVYPMQLQASYRIDTWSEIIPLVPVARLGVSYYYWRVLDGGGETAQFAGGKEAAGGTLGWHATVGAHLLLDFLDGEMAADFERDAGVYNSYLTLEYRYARVDDFGAKDSFRMGDETVLIGLAMDL